MIGLPSPGEVVTAYEAIKKEPRLGSWRFENAMDAGNLAVIQAHLPERVDFGYSPRCEAKTNTEAFYWCYETFGDTVIRYERWPNVRQVDGRPLLGCDYHFAPDKRWILLRRTYLFRDPNDAVWFKLVWW